MEEVADEILCKIISVLSVKEAVRTSILSKRWRELYLFMPRLNFDADTFIVPAWNYRLLRSREYSSREEEHIKSVYRLWEHYLDSKLIESFRLWVPDYSQFGKYIRQMTEGRTRRERQRLNTRDMSCKEVYEIDYTDDYYRWIISAIHMGAEELKLTGFLNFSFEILSALKPTKLKHLHLESCSIPGGARFRFSYDDDEEEEEDDDDDEPVIHSLATLELEDLLIDQTILETIFSTCVKLWKLVLRNCRFVPYLTIAGPSCSNLRCLQIFTSPDTGLKELQVSLANLLEVG